MIGSYMNQKETIMNSQQKQTYNRPSNRFRKRILYLLPSVVAGVFLTLAVLLFLDVQYAQAAPAATLTVDTLRDD